MAGKNQRPAKKGTASCDQRGSSGGVRQGRSRNDEHRNRDRKQAACDDAQFVLARPVFFVGFMGAGKTSVARRVARTCGIASVDMDTYLERREGKRVKDIFAEGGEELFRAIETDVLVELGRKEEPLLISCGGGVVTRKENRALLAELGTVVYLQVTADEAASRISDKSTRPLFQDIEQARKRCEERLPLYEEVADITVNTHGRSVPSLARYVQRQLEKEGVLCRQPR